MLEATGMFSATASAAHFTLAAKVSADGVMTRSRRHRTAMPAPAHSARSCECVDRTSMRAAASSSASVTSSEHSARGTQLCDE
jgi:hypothetical protein